jgi:hydroxymethylbilane synthase
VSDLLRLATRGSALARWQADTTAGLLRAADPDLAVEPLIVRSSGDADQTTALARFGRIGIFTVEVDRNVIEGRAEVGVHSLKDMTTELQEGVRLAGVLPRGPVEDVLVGARLEDLPQGATVATGSMRRKAMLLRARPDLRVVEIRGNVDTRLAKLAAGEADALLMARAGLVRLGLGQHIAEVLEPADFVPAVGQGIVGLTCRDDDEHTWARLAPLREDPAWLEARTERAFLRELRGGCNVPVGGHARVSGDTISIDGCVLSLDGTQRIGAVHAGALETAPDLGTALAMELCDQGAAKLLEAARS